MTEKRVNPGFEDVDQSADPNYYVELLGNISAHEQTQRYKRQSYQILGLGQGQRVLDVGCGTGDDVLAMAKLVGDSGLSVGVDQSETMVNEASARAAQIGPSAKFIAGDIHRLEFDDGYFDGCRADRVLHHVESPRDVLKEMYRVTRPQGRIVAIEPDFESILIDSPDRDTTRKVLNYNTDFLRRHGWMGRQLFGLYEDVGLSEISIMPITGTLYDLSLVDQFFMLSESLESMKERHLISENDAVQWMDQLKEMDEQGKFFGSITMFLASGLKSE